MDGIEMWARYAPLWNSETIAQQAEKWLAGEDGQALLALKASQVNPLRDIVIQARTLEMLAEALTKLGGTAADKGKNPWNRKDQQPGLRTTLARAVDTAIEKSGVDGSEESAVFGELVKQADSRRAEIRAERELRRRKQFLLFVIESYQAQKTQKGEETHERYESGVAKAAEPVRDPRDADRGGRDARGKRVHGRG